MGKGARNPEREQRVDRSLPRSNLQHLPRRRPQTLLKNPYPSSQLVFLFLGLLKPVEELDDHLDPRKIHSEIVDEATYPLDALDLSA